MTLLLQGLLLIWLVQTKVLSTQAPQPCSHCGSEAAGATISAQIDLQRRTSTSLGIEQETRFRASDVLESGASAHRGRFVKTMGLRHKPTMDWGMRSRAKNQEHWDKYWNQLETGQQWGGGGSGFSDDDDDERKNAMSKPPLHAFSNCSTQIDNPLENKNNSDCIATTDPVEDATDPDDDAQSEPLADAGESEPFSQESSSTTGSSTSDIDPDYHYFQQVLDHFTSTTSDSSSVPPIIQAEEFVGAFDSEELHGSTTYSSDKSKFRQYYYVSDEFYKPGKEHSLNFF